jgi:hypothetical protein
VKGHSDPTSSAWTKARSTNMIQAVTRRST